MSRKQYVVVVLLHSHSRSIMGIAADLERLLASSYKAFNCRSAMLRAFTTVGFSLPVNRINSRAFANAKTYPHISCAILSRVGLSMSYRGAQIPSSESQEDIGKLAIGVTGICKSPGWYGRNRIITSRLEACNNLRLCCGCHLLTQQADSAGQFRVGLGYHPATLATHRTRHLGGHQLRSAFGKYVKRMCV